MSCGSIGIADGGLRSRRWVGPTVLRDARLHVELSMVVHCGGRWTMALHQMGREWKGRGVLRWFLTVRIDVLVFVRFKKCIRLRTKSPGVLPTRLPKSLRWVSCACGPSTNALPCLSFVTGSFSCRRPRLASVVCVDGRLYRHFEASPGPAKCSKFVERSSGTIVLRRPRWTVGARTVRRERRIIRLLSRDGEASAVLQEAPRRVPAEMVINVRRRPFAARCSTQAKDVHRVFHCQIILLRHLAAEGSPPAEPDHLRAPRAIPQIQPVLDHVVAAGLGVDARGALAARAAGHLEGGAAGGAATAAAGGGGGVGGFARGGVQDVLHGRGIRAVGAVGGVGLHLEEGRGGGCRGVSRAGGVSGGE